MAGASRFRAVPPMVWSAFIFTAEKLSSRENSAPAAAVTTRASRRRPWAASSFQPPSCMMRTNQAPTKAPIIMMPSRARLMMPLRSANTPARATRISGTV